MNTLSGKKGLIIGIANEHSLAWLRPPFPRRGRRTGNHLSQRQGGALCASAGGSAAERIFMPCDVTVPGQLEAVYERIAKDWGRLDFVQHSIAYARKEDLSGRITDCSAEGFALAMQVSVHSFLRMAKLSER